MVVVDNFSATRIDNNLSNVVVSSLLVFNDNLVLARFDEACENKDIIGALFLPLLDLLRFQGLTSRQLTRQDRVWHVANQDVLLWIWQVFLESTQPVLVVEHAELASEGILHALGDGQAGSHGTLTLAAQMLLDVLLVQEEVEHGNVS